MKRTILLFAIFSTASLRAQTITTNNSLYTPTQLVEDLLLGSCIDVSNVSYTGNSQSVGYFSNGGSLGISEGILLTTGSTSVAVGPNNASDATFIASRSGYPILETVTGVANTQDACVLEFDFVPYNNVVTFNYVFASEEYAEYVCSPYNDVFAFMVTGPGYATNTNITLVPGTTTPVGINTINGGVAGSGFTSCPPGGLNNTAYYVDNTGGTGVQYDGYTVPLTATINVTPCQTYHIRLAIADVGDQYLDSGVFIEAQSFTGGEDIEVRASPDVYEGCTGYFTFTRLNVTPSSEVVNFTVSGTAIEGTDFDTIPSRIIIPANQSSYTLNFQAILDSLSESSESIIITLQGVCACSGSNVDTLMILNNATLNCPPSTGFSVSGYVLSENGLPVNTAAVNLTGQSSQSTSTIADGSYIFHITHPGSHVITPSKSNDITITNGISTADILLIRRHILGSGLLPTPYKIIAADVNGSNTVSTADVLLIRSMILGDISGFTNGKLWAFVPSNHVFADVTNPFPFPANLSYPIISTLTGQNFTGMKLGDVNNSWDHSVPKRSEREVRFSLDEHHAKPGEEIIVLVRVKDFNNVTGYQFTLSWDVSVLELLEVNNKKLNGYYGLRRKAEGLLTVQWNDDRTEDVTLNDNEIVFEMKFRAIGEDGSFSEIKISSELTAAEAYNEVLDLLSVESTNGFVKVSSSSLRNTQHPARNTLSVYPNPFSTSTTIIFTIPNDETVSISIYDVFGRKVKTIEEYFLAGAHQAEWAGNDDMGEKLSKGLYHIRMIAGGNSMSGKVILAK